MFRKGEGKMGDPFFTGDLMFQIVPIFIGIIFVIVIGGIIFNVVNGIGQWRKNEQTPRLSVPSEIKSKRTYVSSHAYAHDDHPTHRTSTSYYVTFEFSSGDRSEFKIPGKEYGQLVEGDVGILTFQGTRYLGFERKHEKSEQYE